MAEAEVEVDVNPSLKVEAPATPAPVEAKEVAPRRFEIPSFTEKEPAPTTAEPAASEPAPEVKTEAPPEKPSNARFERRMANAYRKAAEAQARADVLEKQIKELQPKPQASQGAPRMEDFTDIQEYAKAFAAHETKVALDSHQEKQRQDSLQAQQRNLESNWEAKSDTARAKYEDYDDVVGELKPTNPWSVAIMGAENGPDIAHYLGTHLAEAKKLVALDPVSQIREIGKLEAKLLLQPDKPKQPSKAPAPITPVSGIAVPENEFKPGMDYEKFVRMRNKQLGRS